MTQWRDIPGYEGYYQVSDGGQVRSLDRVVVREDGRLGRVQQRQRGHLKHQSVSGSPMRGGGRGCRACKRIRGRGAI